MNKIFLADQVEMFATHMTNTLALVQTGHFDLAQQALEEADFTLASVMIQLGRTPKMLKELQRI